MDTPIHLDFTITPQPTETTCGPAVLHAVYRYHGLGMDLADLVPAIPTVDGGGTASVMLGLDALRRGFGATIYSCNLQVFDPTWFGPGADLSGRLRAQAAVADPKRAQVSAAYLDFLEAGGRVFLRDIGMELIREALGRGLPIIAGLSSTWLYQCMRDDPRTYQDDDLGIPAGHFVVLHGLNEEAETIRVADPFLHLPYPGSHAYEAGVTRVLNAILLGAVTYDAKLLVLTPPLGGGAG